MTKYDNEQLCQIIDIEGLDYALLHYLDPKDIEDREVRQACVAAKQAMQDVLKILKFDEYFNSICEE